ncbi:hypothetical protein Bpfe_006719 [Biomphalaria pfeifferi]|uniref:DUF19 domain-containing protein n=1 Tax=Biomphalaria pfeifferi TaxID=112525 RepID=A0AAD8C031_BIOPF|nr:hypothetical protein Bpfe_006719 [Biomphalaria pfeifferi]
MANIFWVFTVLVLVEAQLEKKCSLNAIRGCNNFSLLQGTEFHAFFDTATYSEKCRALQSGLKCVQDAQTSCEPQLRLPFDSQRTVIEAVCQTRSQEYKESMACYSKPRLKNDIGSNCLTMLSSSGLSCATFNETVKCVKVAVTMTDGCTARDATLMEDLARLYVKPSVDFLNCSTSKTTSKVLRTTSKVLRLLVTTRSRTWTPIRKTNSSWRSTTLNTQQSNEAHRNSSLEIKVVTITDSSPAIKVVTITDSSPATSTTHSSSQTQRVESFYPQETTSSGPKHLSLLSDVKYSAVTNQGRNIASNLYCNRLSLYVIGLILILFN